MLLEKLTTLERTSKEFMMQAEAEERKLKNELSS
jgi:hypothetical protein